MAETEQPQIYLITPPEFELSAFPARLGAVLDAVPVACVRLALASGDEDRLLRASRTQATGTASSTAPSLAGKADSSNSGGVIR